MPPEGTAGYHPHESPLTMLIPIGLLAVGAAFAGQFFHNFFTDAERAGTAEEEVSQDVSFATQFAEILADEYGLPAGDDLAFRLEVVVEMMDALINRAFVVDPAGDERYIAEARTVAREYLERRYDGES